MSLGGRSRTQANETANETGPIGRTDSREPDRHIMPRPTCGEPACQRQSHRVEPEPIDIRLGQ